VAASAKFPLTTSTAGETKASLAKTELLTEDPLPLLPPSLTLWESWRKEERQTALELSMETTEHPSSKLEDPFLWNKTLAVGHSSPTQRGRSPTEPEPCNKSFETPPYATSTRWAKNFPWKGSLLAHSLSLECEQLTGASPSGCTTPITTEPSYIRESNEFPLDGLCTPRQYCCLTESELIGPPPDVRNLGELEPQLSTPVS